MIPFETFAALGEPTRCAIIALLADGEVSAGDIAGRLALSPPGVSQHLRVLRQAGVVQVRAQAQRRLYSLRRDALMGAAAWLAERAKFWPEWLDMLAKALQQEPPYE